MLMTLFLLAIIAFGLSLLLTPIVRSVALGFNLVDVPDNKRKVHKKPVPRVGGIAVAAAYFGALLLMALFVSDQHPAAASGFATVKLIAPAAVLIFLVGLADDIFNLKPWQKFAVQIVAAAIVVSAGVQFHGVEALKIHPVLGMAISIVWLVACTNAVNLIDGLDGLAAGVALLATLTAMIASLITGNVGLTVATLPLAAALLGFLVFNFNPASIFLGDSGSLLLGFLLGCFGILWSGSSVTPMEMAAPLMAVAVPLIDTTLAIARRFVSGQPIFKADRSHIHHRLLAHGFSHRNAVFLLYAAAAAAGSLALCLIWVRDYWEHVIFAVFAGAVIVGIRQLDYPEFYVLRRLAVFGGVRRHAGATQAQQTPAAKAADMEETAPVLSASHFETRRRPAA